MRVILIQDVPGVGKKYDVKDVHDGYARNFLLRRGLAKMALPQFLSLLEHERTVAEQKAAKERKHFEKIVSALAARPIMIKTKIGGKGRAFGAITASKIQDVLAHSGINIEKSWIILGEPIKQAGETAVQLKLPHGVTGEIKIVIEAE